MRYGRLVALWGLRTVADAWPRIAIQEKKGSIFGTLIDVNIMGINWF